MPIKDELIGKRRTGKNHWMKNDEFLAISMDNTIPPEDKKKLYEGEYKDLATYQKNRSDNIHRETQRRDENLRSFVEQVPNHDQLYADLSAQKTAKAAKPMRQQTRPWSDAEIRATNPIHIDQQLNSLDHLRGDVQEIPERTSDTSEVDKEVQAKRDAKVEQLKHMDPMELKKRIFEMTGTPWQR